MQRYIYAEQTGCTSQTYVHTKRTWRQYVYACTRRARHVCDPARGNSSCSILRFLLQEIETHEDRVDSDFPPVLVFVSIDVLQRHK